MYRSSDSPDARSPCSPITWAGPDPLATTTSRGRFITLEGGEGTGKTTQARLLADALVARGLPILRTREPGGTPGAEALRGLLLSERIALVPLAETLLHVAARAEHVARVIRPALESGTWVLCDRFTDSTMAYQGWGQGVERERVAALAAMVGLVPDATIVLSVPPPTALARLRARGGEGDRYERMDPDFHARVAEGFRAIAAAEPDRCALVEADAPPAAVHAAILRTRQLASLLGGS